jgi:Ni/Co efflux regulator RcnB
MKIKTAISIAAVMCLLAGASAFAEGNGREKHWKEDKHKKHDRGHGRDKHQDRADDRREYEARGAGPDHDLRRGNRLPYAYRSYQYVVEDWRGHRLSAPPRGYHWVQTGGDYVLVAIGTGIIFQIFLN